MLSIVPLSGQDRIRLDLNVLLKNVNIPEVNRSAHQSILQSSPIAIGPVNSRSEANTSLGMLHVFECVFARVSRQDIVISLCPLMQVPPSRCIPLHATVVPLDSTFRSLARHPYCVSFEAQNSSETQF